MFSTFPDGVPGVGLMVLRLALGGLLTFIVLPYLRARHGWNPTVIAVVLLMMLSGLLIVSGYRTRFSAVAAIVAIVLAMIFFNGLPGMEVSDTRTTDILVIAIAVAVACLGPGAFSLDSRLFGRREIVIPRSSPRN